jgi:nucleoside-diphosphate-sugar epimerase
MKFPYRKAIVTGGAGFIGSHLVEELLKMGLEVISIDDYSAGKKENLKPFLSNPKFQEVNCDVTDYNKLKPYFKGMDIVFHEAASKKTICLRDPRRDLEVNAKGTFNILELAKDFKVKKIVHASTGSAINPTSYYGTSKLAGEQYAKVFNHLYNMDITVLRYFHIYGPRQECGDLGGVVSIFGRKAIKNQPLIIFGDGTQQRSFTYVKDVIRANILVAAKKETKGQCYNCASGIRITIKELADKILNSLGKKDLEIKYQDWTPGDIKVFIVDNSKLKSLGFEFETDFDQGLQETLDWLKKYLGK